MPALPVIAIFDIGKTNKKLFLFDEGYNIVFERSKTFDEIVDEEGDACENVENIRLFIFDGLRQIFMHKEFDIKAINFSGYGASLVYLDEEKETCAPLYNYLKEYSPELKKQFYDTYGGEEEFSSRTASPVLGNLNSGMQLYRIKYQNPQLFNKIKYALHLPQYLSFLIAGNTFSDITSIGCHTNLWDFHKNDYHDWVQLEGIKDKLAPITSCTSVMKSCFPGSTYAVGIGLHDSSAALIPYLVNFKEPFILLSTGTWCISLNPFNEKPLTKMELKNDCLCYVSYEGKPVKASRLFTGYDHEQQVQRLSKHFNVPIDKYKSVAFDAVIVKKLLQKVKLKNEADVESKVVKSSLFNQRQLDDFSTYEEAYHQLILDIIDQQHFSTELVLQGSSSKQLFVDGGFSKNPVYMILLASYFPNLGVFAASVAQATSLGTALALHKAWNNNPLPADMIHLKHYSPISLS